MGGLNSVHVDEGALGDILRAYREALDRAVEPCGFLVGTCTRSEEMRGLMETFARRLEYYCAKAPFQWFNFYDYWDEEAESAG